MKRGIQLGKDGANIYVVVAVGNGGVRSAERYTPLCQRPVHLLGTPAV